jgi:hypothetical protein
VRDEPDGGAGEAGTGDVTAEPAGPADGAAGTGEVTAGAGVGKGGGGGGGGGTGGRVATGAGGRGGGGAGSGGEAQADTRAGKQITNRRRCSIGTKIPSCR